MANRYCQAILVALFALASSGCNVSLQSSQYAFFKSLLKAEAPAAEENWQVTWNGGAYAVYAVNHRGGIYFVNESGLIVNFDGWQVTGLTLPNARGQKTAQIRKTVLDDGGISLQFRNGGGDVIGNHVCSAWEPVVLREGPRGWDQRCSNGSKTYTNEIRVNAQNQVVALKQIVMPSAGAIGIVQR